MRRRSRQPVRFDPVLYDIALPRSFSARYGDQVARGLILGGGGLFFVAWQVAYLRRLAAEGISVDTADRVVATSAGSVVAIALLSGRLTWLYRELSLLGRVPALVSALAPASDLRPSQQRAHDLFHQATDAEEATITAIGHAALAASTPSPGLLRRNISVLVGGRDWPSTSLQVTCVDAYTGERCVVTHHTGVAAADAAAASSAVPGLFAPYRIGDRQCMDGGACGSGIHLDLLGGADRALVLSVSNDSKLGEGMMTIPPGGIAKELEDLAATGTTVEFRTPESVDLEDLMSPSAIREALAMGTRQAGADLEMMQAFWGCPRPLPRTPGA